MYEPERHEDMKGDRNLLRDAIESLSEGFALYDEDRRLVLCNKRYREMNHAVADLLAPGLDWEILMRETARRGVYADAIGQEEKFISDRLKNGVEYIKDYELVQTDGTVSLVSVHPIENGGFAVTRTEITEKRKIEEEINESDLLLRTVLDASSSATIMGRIGDGQILYRSPAALKLLGNTKFATEHYVNKEDRADFITMLLAENQIDDYKLDLVNAEGEKFSAALSARIVDYKGEEVVVTSVIDRTEQVKTEALIRQVLEACPVPVQMTKASTGEVLFSSPETTSLFGSVQNAKSYYVSAEARQSYIKQLLAARKVDGHKVELINAKGVPFWAAISSRMIQFQGEEVIVSNTRDLTEDIALQQELNDQREMLFQNEKMSALGELLAGVAHELNNPLSVVVGHSLMLRDEVSDAEPLRRVEKISSAAERCARIVKTFLAMARQQPTRMENCDINTIVDTAVDVAQIGIKAHNIEITGQNIADLPLVQVDADQITQVVINLIINAEQAILTSGQGSKIGVSTEYDEAKQMVEILVKDDGPGIPEKIKARIFEPFFTTKEIGDGTGIGLAFCHRIVLSHGGQIGVMDDVEEGAQFFIRLPVAAETEEGEEMPVEVEASTNKLILVVDDEVDVGELACEILIKAGYQAVFADRALDAIQLLESKNFDVILCDMNMPSMDGRGFYEYLDANRPELISKLAFITGDTMGSGSQGLLRESKRPYLEKPVSPDELRTLVEQLLDSENILMSGDQDG